MTERHKPENIKKKLSLLNYKSIKRWAAKKEDYLQRQDKA